jgi:hypothetical protein
MAVTRGLTKGQKDVLESYMSRWVAEMQAKLDSNTPPNPSRSSGKTQEEFEYELNPIGGKVFGADYIANIEFGRKAGKFPPVREMLRWVKAKLGVSDEDADSVAFLVGRAIAEKGTKLSQSGGQSGVVSEVITKEQIDKLAKDLAAVTARDTKKFIMEALKT